MTQTSGTRFRSNCWTEWLRVVERNTVIAVFSSIRCQECCLSVLLLFKRRGGRRTRAQTERQSPQCSVLRDLLWFCPLRVSRPDAKRVWLGRTVLPPEQTADGLKGKHLEQGKTVLSLSLSLWRPVFFFFCCSSLVLVLFPLSHWNFLLFRLIPLSISLWQSLSHLLFFFSVWLHLTFFLFSVFYLFFPHLQLFHVTLLFYLLSSPLLSSFKPLQPLLFWFLPSGFLDVFSSYVVLFSSHLGLFCPHHILFFSPFFFHPTLFLFSSRRFIKGPQTKSPLAFPRVCSLFPLFFLFHLPTSNSCFSSPFFFQSSPFSLLISFLFSPNPTYVASPRSLPPFSSCWPIFFVSIRHLVWFIPFSRRSPADRSTPVSTLSSLSFCRRALSSPLLLHRFHLHHLIVRLLSPTLYHIFDISLFSLVSSFTHSNFFSTSLDLSSYSHSFLLFLVNFPSFFLSFPQIFALIHPVYPLFASLSHSSPPLLVFFFMNISIRFNYLLVRRTEGFYKP